MSASEENLEGKNPFLGLSLNSDNAGHVISLLAEQPNFHINAVNAEGSSLLHCAVAVKDIGVGLITLLLQNGADTSLRDQNGRTPLMLALHLGKRDIADILLQDIKLKTLTLKEQKELFIKDLERGDLKSAKDRLHRIIKDHKEAIADFVSAECGGRSVLWYACVCGDAELIRLLTSNGVLLGSEETLIESPLYWVITATRENFIIKKEIDINEDKKCEALQALLEAGANLDFQESSREALEQCAVASNSPKVLSFLLEKRLGPKQVSPAMLFEFSMVSSSSRISSSKLEISRSEMSESIKIQDDLSYTNINPDESGVTPLHCAVRRNHIDTVEVLLRTARNININIQDGKGFTALHYAVVNRHVEMIQLLLRYGAAFNIKNKQGKTAYQLSKDLRLNSLSQLFIDHHSMRLVKEGASFIESEESDPEMVIDYLTQGSRRFRQTFEQNSVVKTPFSSQNQKKCFPKTTEADLNVMRQRWLKKLLRQGYNCSFIEESSELCKIKIYHADFYILSSTYVVLSGHEDGGIKVQYSDGAIILTLSIQVEHSDFLIQFFMKPIQYDSKKRILMDSLINISPDRNKVLSIEPEQSDGSALFFKVSYHVNNKAMRNFRECLERLARTENDFQKSLKFEEINSEDVLTIRYHHDVLFDRRTHKAYCALLDKARSATQASSSSNPIPRFQPETKSEFAPKSNSKPENLPRLFLTSLRSDEELASHFKERAKRENAFILFKRGREGYFLYSPRKDEEVVFLGTLEEGTRMANYLHKSILAMELPPKETNLFDRIPHDLFRRGELLEYTETDFRTLSGSSSDLSFSQLLEKLDRGYSHLFRVDFREGAEIEEVSPGDSEYKKKKINAGSKRKGHFLESEASLKPAILSEPSEAKRKTGFIPVSVFPDKKDEWVEGPDGKFYPAGMAPEEKVKKKEQKPQAPEKKKASDKLLRGEIQQIGYLLDEYSEMLQKKNVFEQGIIPGAIYRSLTKAILLRMEVIQGEIHQASDDGENKRLKERHLRLSRLRNYLVHYFCLLHPWNEERVEFLLYLGEWVRNHFKFAKHNEKFGKILNHISLHTMNIDDENCRKLLLKAEEAVFPHLEGLDLLPSKFLIEKLLKGLKYLDGLFKVLDRNPQALLPEDKKRKKYYYVACAAIIMVVEYNNFLIKKKPRVIIPKLQEMLYGANNKLRKPLVHEGDQDYNFNHNALLMVAGQLSSLIEFIENNLRKRGMSDYIVDLIDAQSLHSNPYVLFGSGSPERGVAHSTSNLTKQKP